MNRVGFQKFVPEVDATDCRSWFWKKEIELPEIFVPLYQLLGNKEILAKASSKGLHDYLGFKGRVFLSTVMPDELIDRLRAENYLQLIKNLKPDATMIPDNYTYADDPLFLSWSQTIRLLPLAKDFLELDIPLIGMVKGANILQMQWLIQKEVEMGYASFAMPARELVRDHLLDDFLPYVLRILRDQRQANFELLLYGVGHRLKYKQVNYSNLSWFLEAKHGYYFKNGIQYSLGNSEVRFEECNCEACRGRMPQDIIDLWLIDKEQALMTLVLHNLLDMKRTLAGEK
ncbi:MAG: hypothetical protein ACP5IT_03560 [Thermoproteota archaeon]